MTHPDNATVEPWSNPDTDLLNHKDTVRFLNTTRGKITDGMLMKDFCYVDGRMSCVGRTTCVGCPFCVTTRHTITNDAILKCIKDSLNGTSVLKWFVDNCPEVLV